MYGVCGKEKSLTIVLCTVEDLRIAESGGGKALAIS